jgi:DNA-directed RNA polymerase specialized sigma24 family protein
VSPQPFDPQRTLERAIFKYFLALTISAFDRFCTGVAHGRFPRLDDRDDLWRILVTLTRRKAIDQVQRQRRQKRGGGRVVTEADLEAVGDDEEAGLARLVGDEPTPEFAAQVAEECRRLLGMLDDEPLRALAVARMEGYTTRELADRLDVAPRTIERKLQQIRRVWAREVVP